MDIDRLMSFDYKPNIKPNHGNFFACAVVQGIKPVVERMLAAGTDPNNLDIGKFMLLIVAILNSDIGDIYTEILELILSYKDIHPRIICNMVNELVQFGREETKQNKLIILKKILDKSKESRNIMDALFLRDGIWAFQAPMDAAIQYGNLEAVEILVEYGAEIEKSRNTFNTPLALAAEFKRVKIVEFLIQKGANIHFTVPGDTLRKTILRRAYHIGAQHDCSIHDSFEIIKILLEHGADPGKSGHPNREVLDLAILERRNDVVEIMIEKGADLYVKRNHMYNAYVSASYLTLLHLTIFYENIEAMKMALAAGADPNYEDEFSGMTPLQYVRGEKAVKMAKLLIKAGAKLDVSNTHGATLVRFHCSEIRSDYDDGMAQYLLQKQLTYLQSESELQQRAKKQRIH